MSGLEYLYCSWHWHKGTPYLFIKYSSVPVTNVTYIDPNNYYDGNNYDPDDLTFNLPIDVGFYSISTYTGSAFVDSSAYKGLALYNGLTASSNSMMGFSQVQSYRDPNSGLNTDLNVGSFYQATSTTDFMIRDSDSSSGYDFLKFTNICFPPFTLVETDTELRQIGDLKRGDLVKTLRGLIPLTKNIITNTPSGAKYVKFPKSFFAENVPKRDLYMTGFHAFSLGLKEGTEDVWNWLEARQFIGNMEGIEEVKLETKTYHNLIFDDQEEFSVEGMKVYSHHPNGNPYKLPENEYLNKVNKEERKLNIMTWDDFVKTKPNDVELKKFIADKLKF